MFNLAASGPTRDLPYKLTPLAPHQTPLAKNLKCIMSKLWVCRYNVTVTAFQNLGSEAWQSQPAVSLWTTCPTHVPGPLGSLGPYRYICCCTGSYAAWPWIEPLIHWRPHSNNASCMPLQGTTKPSPFDWLAIMSKNQLKCTKQLLCRVNIMSKQKTSSVIMNVLWVYYEWDLPKHLMHFWCAGAIGSFFYYEWCGKWLWVNRAS